MRATFKFAAAIVTAAAFASAAALPATAACKRYGFTVNDYGKDGPTKDAKALLDKMIASKMSEQGIKDFHTGKKNVSCELFLNFIVFDEHTCTAEATVCWGGSQLPNSEEASAAEDTPTTTKKASSEATESKAKKKDVAKKSEASAEKKKTAALKVPDPKKPAHATEPVTAAEPASAPAAESESASTPAPAAVRATPEVDAAKTETHTVQPVETGSLSEHAKKPAAHHAEAPAPALSNAEPAKDPANAGGGGYPTPMPPQDDSAQ